MAMTDAQELAAIEDTITKILSGGQDVTKGDKRVTRAKLSALYERKDVLTRRIAAASGTGGMSFNTGIIKRAR